MTGVSDDARYIALYLLFASFLVSATLATMFGDTGALLGVGVMFVIAAISVFGGVFERRVTATTPASEGGEARAESTK